MARDAIWSLPAPSPSTGVDGDCDVAVIGGGLTGLTAGLLLARAGRRVVVLEARRLGGGTTGRSTAKVSLLQGTRLSQLSRRHGRETVQAYVEAGREGQEWLRRFCEDHDVPHESRTAYTYATSEAGAEDVIAEQRCAVGLGLPVQLAASSGLPFETTACAALADQFQVDPGVLVSALADQARGHGARLVEDARVRSLRGSGPYRISTTKGELSATSVVVATNYPLTDRAGHFAWFMPQRSYIVALSGVSIDGMYLSAEQPAHSLRDASIAGVPHVLAGGAGHATGRTSSEESHLAHLRKWATGLFPEAVETAAWSAQDFSTADDLPWVGPLLPGRGNLLAAGGYAKWGFSTSVAAAHALTADLLGGRTDWADPMKSWWSRARGLPGVGVNTALTGVHFGRGWGRFLLDRDSTRLCTHLGGPLRWNDVEESWDCPLHGSRFGPDGSVLEGPARCGLRARS